MTSGGKNCDDENEMEIKVSKIKILTEWKIIDFFKECDATGGLLNGKDVCLKVVKESKTNHELKVNLAHSTFF
jgi:hypothetical protein